MSYLFPALRSQAHWQVALPAPIPKLAKELVCPAHRLKNAQLLTGGIFYCLACTKITIFTPKITCTTLTVNCF